MLTLAGAKFESDTLTLADLRFVDALAEDFRLQPSAPLRNMGSAALPLSRVDQDGEPRIVESVPGPGAYEAPDFPFVDDFEGNC